MLNDKTLSFSDIPRIVLSHPFGLLIGIVVLGVLLIYSGTIGCVFKTLFFLALNKPVPNCNPDSILRVRLGEWIINLFQHEWFIWFVLIAGVVIFIYFKWQKS